MRLALTALFLSVSLQAQTAPTTIDVSPTQSRRERLLCLRHRDAELSQQLLRADDPPGQRLALPAVQDWSALDFAQVSGASEVAQHLKAHGAVALQRSAIVNESITSVQRAGQGRDLYAGWPDLAVAAARNSPELVQSLLAHGADPNGATPDGTPVLGVAAVSGAPTTVATLLLAGAKARGDRHGNSALLTATRDGREEVVATMLSHGVSADGRPDDPEPPIVAAAKTGHYAVLHALIAAHAHVDARDSHGVTALMRVAEGTDPAAVRQMLEAGAAVEGVDKAGRTALWFASHRPRSTMHLLSFRPIRPQPRRRMPPSATRNGGISRAA